MNHPLFHLGRVVATPGAIQAFEESGENPNVFLERHQSGDWGDCSEHDRKENDLAVANRLRIFSVYYTSCGAKIWIITEADRSSTCILIPEEY